MREKRVERERRREKETEVRQRNGQTDGQRVSPGEKDSKNLRNEPLDTHTCGHTRTFNVYLMKGL